MAIQETINQLMQQEVQRQTAELARLNSMNVGGNARYLTGEAIKNAQTKGQELLGYANQGLLGENDLNPEMLTQYIQGSPTGSQALNEYLTSKKNLNAQNQELADFRNKAETQIFGKTGGTLQDALSSDQGELGQLNRFLSDQQHATFNEELKPLVQNQLAPMGLLDSGANIELQAKALGQLERSRQNSIMEAALGAKNQIRGLERTDIMGDIGARQQMLSEAFGLQRVGITMEYQRQLELQREQLARDLSGYRGGSGLGQMLGGLAGGAIGLYMGKSPEAAKAGYSMGSGLGGFFDNGS